jgi:SIR2-like domain
VAVSPSNALSARVMLAAAIHAQPGVYAVLLGSGVSRAAGIPTGWEIVQHLVQKAAVAEHPDDPDSHALATGDPEGWWAAHGEGPLGYSSLLAAIAPSSAARQGLLKEYFLAADDDREAGLKIPTAAHRAIAGLVKAGFVKVIVTTNFDTLIEQALDAAGVAYQRISRPEQISATTPLAHADASVIKVHGDWTDLEFRNTIDELDQYPQPWIDLLTQVCNEYGLVISGWSAEWDKALVHVLESTARRYPLYWDSRSSKKTAARDLLAQHGGHVIDADSADELFSSLTASLDALQRLAEPPLTTAIAIARLKRTLPDPIRRIELYDLIRAKTDDVIAALSTVPASAPTYQDIDNALDQLLEATKPLLALLIHGVRHDIHRDHASLWVGALQRLLDGRGFVSQVVIDALLHYPALLALRTMSIVTINEGRDGFLVELLTRPRWTDPYGRRGPANAAEVLHINRALDGDMINKLPRWGGTSWLYPQSHFLKTVLQEVVTENGVETTRYEQLCDDVEYRTGLVQLLTATGTPRPNMGEVASGPSWDAAERPRAENRFRDALASAGEGAWTPLLGDDSLDDVLKRYREILKTYIRY